MDNYKQCSRRNRTCVEEIDWIQRMCTIALEEKNQKKSQVERNKTNNAMPTCGQTTRRPAGKRASKQTVRHTGKRIGEAKERSVAKSCRVEHNFDNNYSDSDDDNTTLLINKGDVNKYSEDDEKSEGKGKHDDEIEWLKAENATLKRQAFSTQLAMPTLTVYVKQLSDSQKSALTTHVRKEIFKSVKCVWHNTYNAVVNSCCEELCIPMKERQTYSSAILKHVRMIVTKKRNYAKLQMMAVCNSK